MCRTARAGIPGVKPTACVEALKLRGGLGFAVNAANDDAVAWLRAGNLGKIRWARGLCYKRRASIGKVV